MPRCPYTTTVQRVLDAARGWRANRRSGLYDLAATSRAAHELEAALADLDAEEGR